MQIRGSTIPKTGTVHACENSFMVVQANACLRFFIITETEFGVIYLERPRRACSIDSTWLWGEKDDFEDF